MKRPFFGIETNKKQVCVYFYLTCAAVKRHKNSVLSKCTFTLPISNIETEGTYKFLPTRWPLIASPAAKVYKIHPAMHV